MTDYQKMYTTLCGAASEALDELTSPLAHGTINAIFILEAALQEAEETYINTTPALH